MYMRIFVVMLGVRRAGGEGEGRSHDGFERQRSAVYITPVRRQSISKDVHQCHDHGTDGSGDRQIRGLTRRQDELAMMSERYQHLITDRTTLHDPPMPFLHKDERSLTVLQLTGRLNHRQAGSHLEHDVHRLGPFPRPDEQQLPRCLLVPHAA
jgi:hypothetical protein